MKTLKDFALKSEILVMLINSVIVFSITNWLNISLVGYLYIVGVVGAKVAQMVTPHLPESWVIHYCNYGEENSILENGFNKPHAEEVLAKDEYKDLYGQKGLDRISSCFVYTKPFVKMCSNRTQLGKLTPIYIKTKVDNSELTMAMFQKFLFVERYGVSFETTTNRETINNALKEGKFSLTRPNSFYSWTHLVLMLAGLHHGSTIDKLLRARKLNKEMITL